LDRGETEFYEQEEEKRYIAMFYYSLLLILGNEGAPKTLAQTIVFIFVIVLGIIFMSFIFGNMAAQVMLMQK